MIIRAYPAERASVLTRLGREGDRRAMGQRKAAVVNPTPGMPLSSVAPIPLRAWALSTSAPRSPLELPDHDRTSGRALAYEGCRSATANDTEKARHQIETVVNWLTSTSAGISYC